MHRAVTRRSLYDQVWNEPMSRLARTYGLSDVGMAKICRKHEIPRPPRGYWAKKQFGKAPARTPLPDPQQDYEIELCDHSEGYVSSSALRNRADQAATKEKTEDAKITVAETLRGSHDLVGRANQELQGAKVDQDGLIITPDDRVLDIRVAKCNLRRSLLIMDALLKALVQRGYAVEKGPTVEILGERLHFGVWEIAEIEKVEPEDHDLTGPYTFGHGGIGS